MCQKVSYKFALKIRKTVTLLFQHRAALLRVDDLLFNPTYNPASRVSIIRLSFLFRYGVEVNMVGFELGNIWKEGGLPFLYATH